MIGVLMFACEVLADSIPASGIGSRLTTVLMRYPRIVHAEHLRHRLFSFNVASSRAIPIKKVVQQVRDEPFMPIHIGAAQSGMQADTELPPDKAWIVISEIESLRNAAIAAVEKMVEAGAHKQVANRYLEPWVWTEVICSGVSPAWNHFFSLRCHPAAEPHIRRIAEITREAIRASVPEELKEGEAHLPLFEAHGRDLDIDSQEDALMISSGRCARVSYMTHNGVRDPQEDINLCNRLIAGNHWSPLEHPAICKADGNGGNFGAGWHQFRKNFSSEYLPAGVSSL